MKRFNAGVWAGIFMMFFTLVFLVQSLDYAYTGSLGPGPGFFPIWICVILLILCLLYIFESLKADGEEGEKLPNGTALKNIGFILLSMVVYILLVSFLGFVLTSTIFLFALLYKEYKWYSNLGISAGVSILLFWVFGSVLHVALPVNGLGW